MSTDTPSAPGSPAVARRCLLIRDLVLPCSIGVHEHERHATQRVRINVRVEVTDDERPIDDSIANVVSYETIVDGIRAIIAGGHINLVETLADRIVELCLANRRASGVRVRIEKLDLYPDADGVGVEVERSR